MVVGTNKRTFSPKLTRSTWNTTLSCLLALLTLTTLGLWAAEPIKDGDLWWQMAYGRWLLENKTLIPDHTVFTWTPTSGNEIYCAWISEIFFYLLYQAAGLPGIFIFRYLCLVVFVVLLLDFGRRQGAAGHPFFWLIALLGVALSRHASNAKPEIISYLLMVIVCWVWWRIKAAQRSRWWTPYIFPLLMLVWVNSHGAFVAGFAYLGLVLAGELLNVLLASEDRLEPVVRRRLLAAVIMSGFVILATPYGWRYPARFIHYFLEGPTTGTDTISAFLSPFSSASNFLYYGLDWVGAALVLVFVFDFTARPLRREKIDWTIVLTNVFFICFSVRFLRTVFFLAPVFAFSAVYLFSKDGGRTLWMKHRSLYVTGVALVCLSILLSGRIIYYSACRTGFQKWLGFGIGYVNPVEEAEFIHEHLSDLKLGNTFNAGGYLLWRLWPKTKIFIDQRQFPFAEWYLEYHEFATGRRVTPFLEKFLCDVWCIPHANNGLMPYFLSSEQWRLAFYGPAAAVFIKKEIRLPKGLSRYGEGIKGIKNLDNGNMVMNFALSIKDLEGAHQILKGMGRCLQRRCHPDVIRSRRDLLAGIEAYYRRDYSLAITRLSMSWKIDSSSNNLYGKRYLVGAYVKQALQAWQMARPRQTLGILKQARTVDPNNAFLCFNIGIIEYYLNGSNTTALKHFLRIFQGNPQAPPNLISTARDVLNGRAPKQPVLVFPPDII